MTSSLPIQPPSRLSFSLRDFTFSVYRFLLRPVDRLILPAENKGNILRGAFGSQLQRVSCFDRAGCGWRCQHPATCPYGAIFEPTQEPDPEVRRLGDMPRPFVLKPPLDRKSEYSRDEIVEFELVVVGKIQDYLPYFGLVFLELGREGIGPARSRFEVLRITGEKFGTEEEIYSGRTNLFRNSRLPLSFAELEAAASVLPAHRATLRFLTPTLLKVDGQEVRVPEFHHVVKRLRDRVHALAYFYCGESPDVDFKAYGELAERVRTVRCDVSWKEQKRYSTKTGERHDMSGFVGTVTYEGDLQPFLPLLLLGEYLHVGEHCVWGHGRYQILA